MSDGLELVGRDAELAALLAAFEAADAGQGRVVSLSGEPGVGKTATATSLAGAARERGALVLWGSCYEGTAQPPYGPWFEALAPLSSGFDGVLPDMERPAADLTPPEARFRLFDAVHRSLAEAARDRTVLLVLDDLQWASSESLGLFAHVAGRAGRSSMLLLGTYRDPDVALDAATPLAVLLAGLVRLPEHVRVHLRGLVVEDVARYLHRSLGDEIPSTIVRAVQEQTSGNPFYVREVARLLVEEGRLVRREGRWLSDFSLAQLGIPETVRDAVRGRVGGLSHSARALLSAACVFSGDLDLETVRAVAGLEESEALDALDEAVATGFLEPTQRSAAPYAFAHAIVRHALAESLNPDRAARLHRRAAEALERLRPHDHAAIAEQYALSVSIPGGERGVPHCVAAAESAMDEHAPRRAVGLLQLALDLVHDDDVSARSLVLCRLAVAQASALEFETAPTTTLLALGALPVDDAVALVLRVAETLREGAPPSAWEPLVRRGGELLGDERDARWARLVVLLDPVEPVGTGPLRVGRWYGHPPEVAAALLATGLEEDEARAIEPFRPRTVSETVALLEQSRRWSSVRARMRALDLAGRDFSLRHRRPVAALDCYRDLLDLGERAGSLPARIEGSSQLALCLALVGDIAGAEHHLARASTLVADLWPGHRLHLLGTVSSAVIAGYVVGTADWQAMGDRLTQWLAGPGPPRAPFAIVFAALAALCRALQGERDEARRRLDEVADLLALMDSQDHAVAGSLWFSAAAAWELRDASSARRLGALIDRHRAASGPPGPASLAHAAARMAALRGEQLEASTCFGAAHKETAEAGLRPMLALVAWEQATLRRDSAAEASAAEAFDRLGMTGWAARARAAAGRALAAPSRPFGLTRREVEVLGRLAAGRTSQEIARDLVISVATVNRHIANIYLKIDARNRAEATSIAIARGLVGS